MAGCRGTLGRYWRGSLLLAIRTLLVFFTVHLFSQRSYATSVPLENGSFTLDLDRSQPEHWTRNQRAFVYATGLGDSCPPNSITAGHILCFTAEDFNRVISSTTLELPEHEAGDIFVLEYEFFSLTGGQTVRVEFFADSGQRVGEEIITVGITDGWERASVNVPPVRGVVPAGATRWRVTLTSVGRSAIDEIGPLFVGEEPNSGSSSDGGFDFSQFDYSDAADTAQGLIDSLDSFECDALSRVVDFDIGGGGLGGIFRAIIGIFGVQVASYFETLRANCLADSQVAIQTGILESVAVPDATQEVVISEGISDPLSISVLDHTNNALAAYPVGEDDLVTAQNRTNRLLVAQATLDAATADRLLGGQRRAYEVQRGASISQADIDGEPNLQFVEGDYGQTRERIIELSDGVGPDFERLAELDLLLPEAPAGGSCFLPDIAELPEDASRVDIAKFTLRWNASQTLGASGFGRVICDMVSRTAYDPVDICFFESGLHLSSIGQIVPPNSACIYGSKGLPGNGAFFLAIQILMMLTAIIGGFKIFFN